VRIEVRYRSLIIMLHVYKTQKWYIHVFVIIFVNVKVKLSLCLSTTP